MRSCPRAIRLDEFVRDFMTLLMGRFGLLDRELLAMSMYNAINIWVYPFAMIAALPLPRQSSPDCQTFSFVMIEMWDQFGSQR
jgi:hypothetical protein